MISIYIYICNLMGLYNNFKTACHFSCGDLQLSKIKCVWTVHISKLSDMTIYSDLSQQGDNNVA